MSLEVVSHAAEGRIEARIEPPARNAWTAIQPAAAGPSRPPAGPCPVERPSAR